jgi:hypothetical protein
MYSYISQNYIDRNLPVKQDALQVEINNKIYIRTCDVYNEDRAHIEATM